MSSVVLCERHRSLNLSKSGRTSWIILCFVVSGTCLFYFVTFCVIFCDEDPEPSLEIFINVFLICFHAI